MDEQLGKGEIRKDAVQNTVEAAASAVGQVATIITSAVKDVAGTVGGLASEVFEIRDQARRAAADQGPASVEVLPDLEVDPEAPGTTTAGTAPGLHPDPDGPTG